MLNQPLALSRLLQLASPMLPVGAYSYSQGLEWAIESGDVKDVDSAKVWIADVLHTYQSHFELPVLARLYQAWQANDMQKVAEWDGFYQAGRDTSEALSETRQMGYSLCRLLNDLNEFPKELMRHIHQLQTPAFPTIYAATAHYWKIPLPACLQAYVWGWLENQASAAMKTVPLGQVAGQKILFSLGELLPAIVQNALALKDDELSNFNPLLTIAGCLHETQYSRLFRS
jgi:urease accessory protein